MSKYERLETAYHKLKEELKRKDELFVEWGAENKELKEELVIMTDLYNTAKFGNEGLMKANANLRLNEEVREARLQELTLENERKDKVRDDHKHEPSRKWGLGWGS
jgi:hypothetical protein